MTLRPPLATMAVISAIWRGVTRIGPWPIETEMVSPGYHGILRTASLHAWSGTSPFFSPSMSTPVSAPRPSRRE